MEEKEVEVKQEVKQELKEEIKQEAKAERPKELGYIFYVERQSKFEKPNPNILAGGNVTNRFYKFQRALGTLEGVLKEWDEKTRLGKVEVDGKVFDCRVMGRHIKTEKILTWIGKQANFSFWPTWYQEPEKKGRTLGRMELLRISNIISLDKRNYAGYIEAIGKLWKIWSNEFVIAIWSDNLKKMVYVRIAGKYPYPDEEGKFAWVEGRFDAKEALIRLVEASPIAFVPPRQKANVGFKLDKPKLFKPAICKIAINQIEVEENLQKQSDPKKLEAFKEKFLKIEQTPKPIKVRLISEGKYSLLDGINRLNAAKSLGHETILAFITGDGQQNYNPKYGAKPQARGNKVSGKLSFTIKISQFPTDIVNVNGNKQFSVQADGREIKIIMKPKSFANLEKADKDYPLWVAAISGKISMVDDKSLVISDASVQVFERKPKPEQLPDQPENKTEDKN